MIYTIKTTIIAFLVGILLGCLVAGYLAWNYQGNKYGKQIAEEQVERNNEIQRLTNKVLVAEREAANVTEQLNKQAVEATKRVADVLADNRKLVAKYNGLYLKSSGSEKPSEAPSTATGTVADTASYCRLSDEVAEALLTEAARADEAAEYARIAHEYALKIQQQREELLNE